MPITIKTKKPVQADVGVQNLHKGQVVTENHEQEPVDVEGLQGQKQVAAMDFKANVGIEVSATINTGNYNSVRVQCSLRIDCPPDDIDETATFIEDWVNTKMESLTSTIEGAAG